MDVQLWSDGIWGTMVIARELIAVLRGATEEDVARALERATAPGAVGPMIAEPSDLLSFFNSMLDELIDEAVSKEVEDSIHATALAHIRTMRGDQLQ